MTVTRAETTNLSVQSTIKRNFLEKNQCKLTRKNKKDERDQTKWIMLIRVMT